MISQGLETNNLLSMFWQNFFLKNKKVNYQIMRAANGKKTTVMLLNKDMKTNSILEIKPAHFKWEVVWGCCCLFFFFFNFLLILNNFSKSLIILKKDFHFFGSFPLKHENLKKREKTL